VLAAGLALPAADACALLGDRLQLFAAETFTYDSNLLRVSKDANAFATVGSSDLSDIYLTTSAGFNLNVPVGRQLFVGGYAINRIDYSRFGDLSYTGREGRGIWFWQLGNSLSGQVGFTDTTQQATFVNFTTRIKDLVTTQTGFANASYLFNPYWQLRAAVDGLHQEHGEATRKDQDINITGTEGGINFISRRGNTLGLLLRNEDGRYPNRQIGAFDNAYTQRTASIVLDWRITPASRVSGRIGHTKREFDTLSQRDFSGGVGRAVYDWTPGGRFSLSAIALRDISVYEDIRSSFVLVTGVALRPDYRIDDKLSLGAVADISKREYLGDPTGATRADKVHTLGITATWLPSRNTSVIASLTRETRASDVQFNDYEAWVVFLRGRIAF
jgi:exopolysaccharide biosynthesis operon protein EpsL